MVAEQLPDNSELRVDVLLEGIESYRADHSNRRSKPEGYAVWEIHPVMALHVDQ